MDNGAPGLRDLLSVWDGVISPQITLQRLPEAISQMEKVLGDLAPRPPDFEDLQESLAIVSRLWSSHGDLMVIPKRHAKRIPFFLFSGEPCLADDTEFVRAYLGLLNASPTRPGTIVALVRAFLLHYPDRKPAFHKLREGIRRALLSSRSLRVEAWKKRCSTYGLLNHDAPAGVWRKFSDESASLSSHMVEAGLSGDLCAGAFVARVHDAAFAGIREQMSSGMFSVHQIDRVLELAASPFASGRLRFQPKKSLVAESLLMPLVSQTPPAEVVQRVKGFLLRFIGHPRVYSRAWIGVRGEAKAVLLRWLVGETLESFFGLLDSTAKELHWKDRKGFWTAYLQAGHIADAWIVLGSAADSIARRRLQDLIGSYGRLRGADSKQSALLMRIQNLIIVEWSHNGACRTWQAEVDGAPRLYQREYSARELRDESEIRVVHHGSSWRATMRRHIQSETGIEISRRFSY